MAVVNQINCASTDNVGKCEICGEAILRGDTFFIASLHDDGQIYSGIVCNTCVENEMDEPCDDDDCYADEDYGCYGRDDYY